MTNNNQYIFNPDYSFPPGEYLIELLEARGMTQQELAKRTGYTPKAINEIVKAKSVITTSMAIALSSVLDTKPEYWLGLQIQYDLYERQLKEREAEEAQAAWLSQNFDYDALVHEGYLPKTKDVLEKLKNILYFFNVANIDAYNSIYGNGCGAACRMVGVQKIKHGNIAAWVRMGQLNAEKMDLPKYNATDFKKTLYEIRELTILQPEAFQVQLIKKCGKVGVAVVFVKELPNTAMSGAAYWINSGKTPVIQLSIRYKTNDHLWFTFFHEAGHILLHEKEIFVDLSSTQRDHLEDEANQFSANLLIPPEGYESFSAEFYGGEKRILEFANKLGIHPGIVVGRLQHDSKITYRMFNHLKMRLEWANSD